VVAVSDAGVFRRWRPWQPAVVAAAVVTMWWLFLRDVRPVDLPVFLESGRQVLSHHDPYPSLQSPTLTTNSAFVYPLVVAWLFAPLAALPDWVAGPLFVTLSIAALVLGCRLAAPRSPLVPVAVVCSAGALIGLEDGTLNALLFLALACAWRWRDRPVPAGVVLALAVVAKLFLWLLLAWPLLAGRRTLTLVATGTTAGLLTVGFLAGRTGPLAFFRLLGKLSAIESPHGKSLTALLLLLGVPRPVASVLVLALVAAALAGAWFAIRHEKLSETGLFGIVIAISILSSPIVWVHYDVLLFLALLPGSNATRKAGLLAVATWAQGLPHTVASAAHGTGHGPDWWGPVIGSAVAAVVGIVAVRSARGSATPTPSGADENRGRGVPDTDTLSCTVRP
jgi:hypothetical protein